MYEPHTSKTSLKKQRPSPFYRLKRKITHPTQMPIYLSALWGFLAILIVPPIIDKFHLGVEYYQIIFIPPLVIAGFCGYFMFRRNVYFAGRYDYFGNNRGVLVHGYPAKLYGVIYMILFWGFALVWAAEFIFHW